MPTPKRRKLALIWSVVDIQREVFSWIISFDDISRVSLVCWSWNLNIYAAVKIARLSLSNCASALEKLTNLERLTLQRAASYGSSRHRLEQIFDSPIVVQSLSNISHLNLDVGSNLSPDLAWMFAIIAQAPRHLLSLRGPPSLLPYLANKSHIVNSLTSLELVMPDPSQRMSDLQLASHFTRLQSLVASSCPTFSDLTYQVDISNLTELRTVDFALVQCPDPNEGPVAFGAHLVNALARFSKLEEIRVPITRVSSIPIPWRKRRDRSGPMMEEICQRYLDIIASTDDLRARWLLFSAHLSGVQLQSGFFNSRTVSNHEQFSILVLASHHGCTRAIESLLGTPVRAPAIQLMVPIPGPTLVKAFVAACLLEAVAVAEFLLKFIDENNVDCDFKCEPFGFSVMQVAEAVGLSQTVMRISSRVCGRHLTPPRTRRDTSHFNEFDSRSSGTTLLTLVSFW